MTLSRRCASTPGGDAGGAALAATYYVSDLAASASQDGEARAWTLDPLRRVRAETATGAQAADRTFYYDTDADSPSWTAQAADGLRWTRNITGPAGELAAIQDSQAGIKLQLPNLHGDITATADPQAASPASSQRTDEFGIPQAGPASRYQYLGAKQRQTALPAGLMLMGARLYNPAAGRFLQVDPVVGGSANDYDYTFQDPVNQTDLDGRPPQSGRFGSPPLFIRGRWVYGRGGQGVSRTASLRTPRWAGASLVGVEV